MDDNLIELDDIPLVKKKLLERDIEAKVCRYAEKKGWRSMKFMSPNYRSVPDRIFFKHPQRVFFIEFKAPGKKPSEKQDREIKRLRAEGFAVSVIDDIKKGIEFVDVIDDMTELGL